MQWNGHRYYDYDALGNPVASVGQHLTRTFSQGRKSIRLGPAQLAGAAVRAGAGRFLTVDPINGEPLSPISFNRYLYAEADPANRLDPLGMAGGEDAIMLGPSAEILAPRTVFLGAVRSAQNGNQVFADFLGRLHRRMRTPHRRARPCDDWDGRRPACDSDVATLSIPVLYEEGRGSDGLEHKPRHPKEGAAGK